MRERITEIFVSIVSDVANVADVADVSVVPANMDLASPTRNGSQLLEYICTHLALTLPKFIQ